MAKKASSKKAGSAKPAAFDRKLVRMCTDVFPPFADMGRFAELARQEDPANAIPGLAHAFGAGILLPEPLRIAFVTAKKWANGRTLKVAFLGGGSQQQEFTARTADALSLYGNITFQWGVPAAQSDIRVAYNRNAGAWSYMGTDCLGIPKNQPTLNLGWLDEAVVLHEFLHALAAIHEHQHPESAIPWNREAVYRYYGGPPNNWDRQTIDSNIFAAYSVGQTQFSAYDPKSVMHYATDSALLTDPSRATGWNSTLSANDKGFLASMYPKTTTPPPPVEPPTDRVATTMQILDQAGKMMATYAIKRTA